MSGTATLVLRTETTKWIICTEVIQKMAINNSRVDLWLPAASASMRNDSRNNSRKKPCPLADFPSAFCFHIYFQIKLFLVGTFQCIEIQKKSHYCSISPTLRKEKNLNILFLEYLCVCFFSEFVWSLEEHFHSADQHCRNPYHFIFLESHILHSRPTGCVFLPYGKTVSFFKPG